MLALETASEPPQVLRRDCGVWPGDQVLVELAPEPGAASDAVGTYEAAVNTVEIQFNHPDEPTTCVFPLPRAIVVGAVGVAMGVARVVAWQSLRRGGLRAFA